MAFFIDDILLAPLKSLTWLAGKIRDAAEAEMENEGERLTDRLREIYMLLETGRMDQASFDDEEEQILNRLEALEAGGAGDEPDADDEADEEAADGGEECGGPLCANDESSIG